VIGVIGDNDCETKSAANSSEEICEESISDGKMMRLSLRDPVSVTRPLSADCDSLKSFAVPKDVKLTE
jgi:hypothetical protein